MLWSLPSARIVRLVLVPILSLWIAGAGCMMGCEGMVAASAATVPGLSPEKPSVHTSGRKATIVASGHACSSGGSHSCCAENTGKTEPVAVRASQSDTTLFASGGSSTGMMNCPLAVSRAAIAGKVRSSEVAAAPALAHSSLPAEKLLEQTAPLSAPLRLPNRGHTYLCCCVFLI
jgi:hypothetical protein